MAAGALAPGRLDSWNKGAAIVANRIAHGMGIERKGLVEETLEYLKTL